MFSDAKTGFKLDYLTYFQVLVEKRAKNQVLGHSAQRNNRKANPCTEKPLVILLRNKYCKIVP